MLLFNKRKAMSDFYNTHKVFLHWYLINHSDVSEKFYYLLMQYMVKCLRNDIEELICIDEREQRTWMMKLVDEFAMKNKLC